jgi:hypothetical protein
MGTLVQFALLDCETVYSWRWALLIWRNMMPPFAWQDNKYMVTENHSIKERRTLPKPIQII